MCFLCIFIFEVNKNSKDVMSYMPITNKVILLDAGHGGIDPGATNEDKSILEKDINLQITLKLRELLESSGCLVLLTREEDTSLYEEEAGKTTRQKYNENLKNRRKMIEESGVDAFVSIHLNKFEQSKYYGAQTFYPEGQNDSKLLSQFIQDELKRVVDKTNQRKIKPSKDIYLLKENKIPSVLIECGFLSNEKESKLLNDEKYQEKVAWAIYAGIQKYFGSNVHN
ncbi:germination-specific N-acetylmuramoyl-L-alanine amidase [[Clostridium] sordellii]|uniref:Germination-specific N-acetylmuramoyl-L-alanine amidase n=2 Tax=Paraclostridium sordellii TaxID=1505 RepID=A0A0A1RVP7_PARSO|nr:Germination-specific N-acetylmuramoyl-L-alanine amidase, Autolysin [[Clostridium] sordellii] [Paeniclostridium sordellii]CEK31240.1 germination-specific N-acetylmuramoyl-L-alanine amidase [[Clostridium] sordellii] [Paeniclostridium sordellii]CEK39841.1 Germination-specific N-acetylmuramoyl-L-alanineamidase, Autolysin [[Clostridium] sordellii] [Paeniclostridium sordellii]CEN20997.1 germination-specific N-acetylmuramoyl-L-alanine amidase [[Clostridium] sordellii] [Paeniclostridium sordellii]CE